MKHVDVRMLMILFSLIYVESIFFCPCKRAAPHCASHTLTSAVYYQTSMFLHILIMCFYWRGTHMQCIGVQDSMVTTLGGVVHAMH